MAAVLAPTQPPTPLQTVQAEGHRYAYRRVGQGAGPPVLLLHGITTHAFLSEPVLRGLADLYLTFAIAERLVADIPGARLVRLPTAGHFSPIDEPGLVAAALRAHFDAAG
jgi:pimeloyl-ACP methyl ester carboxylesterase